MATKEALDIISGAQFTPEVLDPIFARAQELRDEDLIPDLRRRNAGRFVGARAVNLFYGESTRTRTSFEMAEVAWGVGYSSTADAKTFSSVAKGETLAHTIEVVARYRPDFIVLRSDHAGGAAEAASLVDVPVINAGDGRKGEEKGKEPEHPTQGELDAFTIKDEIGRLDHLTVAFMGDLRYGRTVRSLVHILSQYEGNHFRFISHPDFAVCEDIRELLEASESSTYEEFDDATVMDGEDSILQDTDVLYVTRTQTNLGATKLDKNDFRVTKGRADKMPDHGIFMHPMPIDRSDLETTEIDPAVDHHPRSRFFDQAGNGMYIRMANIEEILAINWPEELA